MTTAEAMAALEASQTRRMEARAQRIRAVALCRQAGVAWREIAAVVEQAQQNAHRKYAEDIETVTLPKKPLSEQEALAQLRAANAAVAEASDRVIVDVAAARNAGATWTDVGSATGQATSDAHRMFAPYLITKTVISPVPRTQRALFLARERER